MPRRKRASLPLSQSEENAVAAATEGRRKSARLQDVAARQQDHEPVPQVDPKEIPIKSPTKPKTAKNVAPPNPKKARANEDDVVITIEDDDENNESDKIESQPEKSGPLAGHSAQIIEMVAVLQRLPVESQRCLQWVANQHRMGAPDMYNTQPPPYKDLSDHDGNDVGVSNHEHQRSESMQMLEDENNINGHANDPGAIANDMQQSQSATPAPTAAATAGDATSHSMATGTTTTNHNAACVVVVEASSGERMKPPPPPTNGAAAGINALAVPPASMKYYLPCEWLRCTHQSCDYTALVIHLNTAHALAKTAPAPAVPADELYTCHWDLCSFTAPSWLELRCHVYQHAHHTHLKSMGEALLSRKKVNPCLVDSRRRNSLPDGAPTRTQYACEWTDCKACFEEMYELGIHSRKHVEFESSQRRPKEKGKRLVAGKDAKLSTAHMIRCGWAECGKLMEHPWRMMDHVRVHVGESQMACPNCGSTFASYHKFYAHFYRQAEEKLYQCVHCFKHFANEELLTSHMYFHVNCYKCTMCDMTCPSPSALAKHVRQRHMDVKMFACRECPLRTLLKKDLERHIMTQHERHVYVCDEYDCEFETTSYYMMRMHDKRVHCGIGPAIYACDCCPERFRRGTQLSEHLIAEHQFQLPSGHSRFTYRPDLDGVFRLQTMRMESLEVTQAIMSPSRSDLQAADLQAAAAKQANVTYEVSEVRAIKKDGSISMQSSDDDDKANVGRHILSVTVTAQSNANDVDVNDAAAAKTTVAVSAAGAHWSMPKLRFSEDESSMDVADVAARRKNTTRKAKTAAQRRLAHMEKPEQPSEAHFVDPLPQTSSKIKNIQDFSVMKRYLRKENTTDTKIVIELTKVDASGNVLRSETMCADEFRVE